MEAQFGSCYEMVKIIVTRCAAINCDFLNQFGTEFAF